MTSAGEWASSWRDALAEAELDVAQTEAMLARLHADAEHPLELPGTWRPPAGLGPLPTSEADRARALLERHRRVAAELSAAMTANRQHRRLTASATQRREAVPVYVDTAV